MSSGSEVTAERVGGIVHDVELDVQVALRLVENHAARAGVLLGFAAVRMLAAIAIEIALVTEALHHQGPR